MPPSSSDNCHRVFLVHGRDHGACGALIAFLEALGLEVIDWRKATEYAGGGAPYTGDIVEAGMKHAHAIVVLLTPDDIGSVRPCFLERADGPDEREPTGQARLNVVFEAGIAMARYRDQVVLVEVGRVRKMSDIDGRTVVRMDDSFERRWDLVLRLKSVGLAANTDRNDSWRTAGSFSSGRLTSPRDGSEVDHQERVSGMVAGLSPETSALIIVKSAHSRLYWPQGEAQPLRDDRFDSVANFGRNEKVDSGKEYILMLIAGGLADIDPLRAAIGHRVSYLPPGVRVLDQATVIRR